MSIPQKSQVIPEGDAVATVSTVFEALVDAFDGFRLMDGTTLTATDKFLNIDAVSDARLPLILFRTGSVQAVEYQAFVQLVTFQPKAVIKVVGEPGDADDTLRAVIDDLFAIMALYRGLFVDSDYKVYSYSRENLARIDKGELSQLADWSGPYITSVTVRENTGSTNFALADVMFNMQFMYDTTPDASPPPRVFTTGLVPNPSADFAPGDAYSLEQPVSLDDQKSVGRYGGPVALPTDFGVKLMNPPFVRGVMPPYIDQQPYDQIVKEISLTPLTKTLTHSFTSRLSAIAIMLDYSSVDIARTGTWTTSDASKATVSSRGVVTGIAAGTATITISYGGATASCLFTIT